MALSQKVFTCCYEIKILKQTKLIWTNYYLNTKSNADYFLDSFIVDIFTA